MKLAHVAAAIMGVASVWWRLTSEQRALTPERLFYIFAALFTAYVNALALFG